MIARGCQQTPVPGWQYVNGCWTPPWLHLPPPPPPPPWWVTAAHAAWPLWVAGLAVAACVALVISVTGKPGRR